MDATLFRFMPLFTVSPNRGPSLEAEVAGQRVGQGKGGHHRPVPVVQQQGDESLVQHDGFLRLP